MYRIGVLLVCSSTNLAFAQRYSACSELGNCSSGVAGPVGKAIGLLVLLAFFYEGFQESYKKRGGKGVVFALLFLLALGFFFYFSGGSFISILVIITSVWWYSPLVDLIFPEDERGGEE